MNNSAKNKYLIDFAVLILQCMPLFRITHCENFTPNEFPELLTVGVAICQHFLRQHQFRILKYSETVSSLELQTPHCVNYPG